MDEELYVLADFTPDGEFKNFIRKGRNVSISGYDKLTAARRGLSQSKGQKNWKGTLEYPNAKIIKITSMEVINE